MSEKMLLNFAVAPSFTLTAVALPNVIDFFTNSSVSDRRAGDGSPSNVVRAEGHTGCIQEIGGRKHAE